MLFLQDGSERPIESLSLIDAVMPDVVASRQQQLQNNQKPQVVKTEPANSNGEKNHFSLPTLFKLDISGVGDVVNIDNVDVSVPFNLNCRETKKLNVRRSRFEAFHFF